MSERYVYSPDYNYYFVTCTVVAWLDVFTRQDYIQILYDTLNYCRKNWGLNLHGYGIMSNHIHLLISSDDRPLNKTLKSFKQYSAKQILESIEESPVESRKKWMVNLMAFAGKKMGQNHQFWQHNNHFLPLKNDERVRAALNYIHENPVKAGIVPRAEYYSNSSAYDYYSGKQGLMEVDIIEGL